MLNVHYIICILQIGHTFFKNDHLIGRDTDRSVFLIGCQINSCPIFLTVHITFRVFRIHPTSCITNGCTYRPTTFFPYRFPYRQMQFIFTWRSTRAYCGTFVLSFRFCFFNGFFLFLRGNHSFSNNFVFSFLLIRQRGSIKYRGFESRSLRIFSDYSYYRTHLFYRFHFRNFHIRFSCQRQVIGFGRQFRDYRIAYFICHRAIKEINTYGRSNQQYRYRCYCYPSTVWIYNPFLSRGYQLLFQLFPTESGYRLGVVL